MQTLSHKFVIVLVKRFLPISQVLNEFCLESQNGRCVPAVSLRPVEQASTLGVNQSCLRRLGHRPLAILRSRGRLNLEIFYVGPMKRQF